MSRYSGIQKEAQLKALVFADYFDGKSFAFEQEVDNIDFIVTDPRTRGEFLFAEAMGSGAGVHYLWGEAKKGVQDLFEMFTQLLLTCKKAYDRARHLAPPWLCCFDEGRIAFVSFHEILSIFNELDINWTQVPSRHDTGDFAKALGKVRDLIGGKIMVFNFGEDDGDIRAFISAHIGVEGVNGIKSPITRDNFVQIFIKWVKDVKPSINISATEWVDFKVNGILDCDFFRADMMSVGGDTITEKLKIILKNDNYKLQEKIKDRLFTSDIGFSDGGEAYKRFWNRYERPPAREYQQYIIDRRDLLVPVNIREFKGSFFTPALWSAKSKEYLAAVFGEDWQDEYYIWDCAAGTGNLLAGLTNEYNVWASDIDAGNVETIQSLIDIDDKLNLLPGHVFQFDFLNDDFDKVPEGLRKIIADPEKRKRLIIYINPPYAEVSSLGAITTRGRKAGVNQSKIHNKYTAFLGTAGRELFALFLARIYFELSGSKIGEFSKMKTLNGSAFEKFRGFFKAKLEKCFVVPGNTFENVKSSFPIGFKIWNTEQNETFKQITSEVFDANNNFIGTKEFFALTKDQFINKWISEYKIKGKENIGYMDGINGNDFQHNNNVYITNSKEALPNPRGIWINEKNILECSMYFAVRHCIDYVWTNNNDQYLYPINEAYKTDIEFQNDCLIYTLFEGRNNIQCAHGTNHWIPFTEKQVKAKEKFDSNFMSTFLKGRVLSAEAQAVYDAGLALWQYYHAKITPPVGGLGGVNPVNASLYDIRAYFQGRDASGRMNNTSTDDTYNTLIDSLRDALKTLSEKLQPKVYEYGFLK